MPLMAFTVLISMCLFAWAASEGAWLVAAGIALILILRIKGFAEERASRPGFPPHQ
jgi:hypothetical protein